MANHIEKFNSIQLLRAVAIVLVIHCHVLDFQVNIKPVCYQSDFFYLQNFGAVGVDLFFVISGFIITIVSLQYAVSSNSFFFFLKRVVRVLPLYWLVSFALVFIVYATTGSFPDTKSIIKTIIVFPPPGFSVPVLLQGWTLTFEILFYSVIALAIAINNRKYLFYASLFFLTCITLNHITGKHFYPLNFFGNSLILEFLMGVVAAELYLSKTTISVQSAVFIVLIGIMGLLLTLVRGFGKISEMEQIFNGILSLQRALLWGIPCMLLVIGITMLEKRSCFKVHAVWMAIGDASFSLYLIHSILLYYLYAAWKVLHISSNVQGDILALISIAIIITAGMLFYKWVEKPFLGYLNKFIRRFKNNNLLVNKSVEV